MKKSITLLIALVMFLGMMTACSGDKPEAVTGNFTYNSYTTALGNNWNPHTWENNADQSILSYLSEGFVSLSVKDSVNGVYQWVYGMAESIEDVTASAQDDLTKFAVTLPEGKTAADVTEGYVYEIKLNKEAKWQDGTPINADTYIYSMQQLLAPEMHNYRANLYIAGESAVAGGYAYYNSGAPIYSAMVPAYGEGEDADYSFDLDAGIAAGTVYVNVTSDAMTLYNMSLASLNSDYGVGLDAEIGQLADAANAYGYTKVTADNIETVKTVVNTMLSGLFGITEEADLANYIKEALFVNNGEKGEVMSYDTVGCYKVDDYTIRYVCQTAIEKNYFLTSCTDTWLVHEATYEAGKDTSGELVTTDYGTKLENSVSYGPYKMESIQADKQVVFVQNENWYGWEKVGDSLISYTNFEVDGEVRQQYQTTRIVIDVMDESGAKQAFLKGELSAWSPSAEELTTYATSDQLYKVDETYTMSFFFNTGIDALKEMDNSKGNTNSVVLSNTNFRKGFSLAMDRAEYVTATPGYKAAYAIMNNLYFYDVYNDPTSSYRNSDPAMQAICNLYGVEYGDGKAYADLRSAYQSITGYNLTEAKALMKTACDELVAEGLYTAGDEIYIRIGWAAGALESSDNNQIALMNKYINAAAEGSGFGKITLEGIGNIENRYADVPNGEYAIGYGAWGGAAFYPFRNFQVYCDPDQYDLNETGCWDPTTEELTLNVGGEDVTMTWQEWSNALIGTGKYAGADFATKLQITASMEELYLQKYYRIPICGTTICELLSYKNSYYTEDYNIMYDFGGFRLMSYNYTDEEWTAFVAEQGGTLSYE